MSFISLLSDLLNEVKEIHVALANKRLQNKATRTMKNSDLTQRIDHILASNRVQICEGGKTLLLILF